MVLALTVGGKLALRMISAGFFRAVNDIILAVWGGGNFSHVVIEIHYIDIHRCLNFNNNMHDSTIVVVTGHEGLNL